MTIEYFHLFLEEKYFIQRACFFNEKYNFTRQNLLYCELLHYLQSKMCELIEHSSTIEVCLHVTFLARVRYYYRY